MARRSPRCSRGSPREHDVPLYPFFLDGVAGDPELNQADGIHPSAAGIELIVERILPTVEHWLGDEHRTPVRVGHPVARPAYRAMLHPT